MHPFERLIDAHVHVWTTDLARYPLAPNHKPGDMRPPHFGPEDILHHARPSGVDRVVLIQMSHYGTDNHYMLDVIAAAPHTFRGIAIVDPRSPTVEQKIVDLKGQGVVGFRIVSFDGPAGTTPDNWLDHPGYEAMFRCAARERLSICPLLEPAALPALGRMCRRFPDTRVIIDHMARIGITGAVDPAHVESLCALAGFPEVRVKVSAFYALGEKKPPHLDLAPLIRTLRDTFGADRLMWASDCPFQVEKESYEDSISLVRDKLDFLTAEDRQQMLYRTAEELFFDERAG